MAQLLTQLVNLDTSKFKPGLLGSAYKIGYESGDPGFFDRLIVDIQDNYNMVLEAIGSDNMLELAPDLYHSINQYVRKSIIC